MTRDYQEFTELLVELRAQAGLTQVEVAAILQFGQSAVSRMEQGVRRVDVIELRQLCNVLGISLTDFVRRLEERLDDT